MQLDQGDLHSGRPEAGARAWGGAPACSRLGERLQHALLSLVGRNPDAVSAGPSAAKPDLRKARSSRRYGELGAPAGREILMAFREEIEQGLLDQSAIRGARPQGGLAAADCSPSRRCRARSATKRTSSRTARTGSLLLVQLEFPGLRSSRDRGCR